MLFRFSIDTNDLNISFINFWRNGRNIPHTLSSVIELVLVSTHRILWESPHFYSHHISTIVQSFAFNIAFKFTGEKFCTPFNINDNLLSSSMLNIFLVSSDIFCSSLWYGWYSARNKFKHARYFQWEFSTCVLCVFLSYHVKHQFKNIVDGYLLIWIAKLA